jgi:hypothetical protein
MATLSQVDLLEMAREVLLVCQDGEHTLQNIIADLTVTKSAQITINRIFDGQVNERSRAKNLQLLLLRRINTAAALLVGFVPNYSGRFCIFANLPRFLMPTINMIVRDESADSRFVRVVLCLRAVSVKVPGTNYLPSFSDRYLKESTYTNTCTKADTRETTEQQCGRYSIVG